MSLWILLIITTNTEAMPNLRPLKALAIRHYFGSSYGRYVRLWRYCYHRYPGFSDWLLKLRVGKELGVQNFDSTTRYLEKLVSEVKEIRGIADILGEYFASYSEGYEYRKLLNVLDSVSDIWKSFRPDAYLYYLSRVLSRELPDSAEKLKKQLIAEFPDSPYAGILVSKVKGLDSVSVGLVYYYTGRYRDALRLLPAQKYPKEYLLSLYYLGKLREFLDSFRDLETLLSPSERQGLRFKRAIVYERLGRYRDAINELVDLGKSSQKWRERSVYELSNIAIEKRWIKRILHVLKSLPQKGAPVYSRLGLLYLITADTSKAIYWFKKNLDSEDNFYRTQAYYFMYKLTKNPVYLDSLLMDYPLSYYLWITGMPPRGFRRVEETIDTTTVSDRFKLFSYIHDNDWAKDELFSKGFTLSDALYARAVGNAYLSTYIADRVFQRTGRADSLLLSMLFPYPEKWRFMSKFRGLVPLVLALIREESTYRHNAVSQAGAVGFMQLIPETYLLVSGSGDYTTVFRPIENLMTGTKYLEKLLNELGDTVLTIAAYNAGPTRVRKWWKNWKKAVVNNDQLLFVEFIPYRETRNYVRRVLRSMRIYQWLYRGKF